MTNNGFPHTLEGVRQFAAAAAATGEFVSHFALTAANFTPDYREPGVESIDAIDADIGSADDVQDPLLTAHKLAKFYLISTGDALVSCCGLVRKGHPNHVGSAALARTVAEHGSKVMFLADPEAGWKARILRMYLLFKDGMNEYRSSNNDGVTQLLNLWDKWRARTGKEFFGTTKQKIGSNRDLIERYFDHDLAYDELSRPVHGNAIWMTMVVLQEQKRTNYAWCATLRNFTFALDVCLSAADRLCELWELDRDEVLATLAEHHSVEALTWNELNRRCEIVRVGVDMLTAGVQTDFTNDPQPRR